MRPDHTSHIYQAWLRAIGAGRGVASAIDALGSTPARERALAAWVDAAATAEDAMRQSRGGDAESARPKLIMALDALVNGAAGDLADPAWQLVLSAFADLDDAAPDTRRGAHPLGESCLDG